MAGVAVLSSSGRSGRAGCSDSVKERFLCPAWHQQYCLHFLILKSEEFPVGLFEGKWK
jgi:hypothetical protein